MTGPSAPPTAPFPRVALGAGWLFAAVATAVLGWLVFALSDRGGGRLVGVLLLAVAGLGAVAGVVLLSGRPARRLSLASSVVFVLGGLLVAVVALVDGRMFATDVLLCAGVPLAAGVLTGLAALRHR